MNQNVITINDIMIEHDVIITKLLRIINLKNTSIRTITFIIINQNKRFVYNKKR